MSIRIRTKSEKTDKTSARRTHRTENSQSINSPLEYFMELQRAIGNHAVAHIVQAKLKIGQPGDKYEQEADRVADMVMTMPAPQVFRQSEDEEEIIQRQPLEEKQEFQRQEKDEEVLQMQPEEDDETLHTKENSGRISIVPLKVQANINNIRGSGKPLPKPDRTFFESRFGHDFSQVRVHNDSQAAETAQDVKAKAFTVGRDVVFGAGQYNPATSKGKKLLAHELAYVIQNSTINRKTSSQ